MLNNHLSRSKEQLVDLILKLNNSANDMAKMITTSKEDVDKATSNFLELFQTSIAQDRGFGFHFFDRNKDTIEGFLKANLLDHHAIYYY